MQQMSAGLQDVLGMTLAGAGLTMTETTVMNYLKSSGFPRLLWGFTPSSRSSSSSPSTSLGMVQMNVTVPHHQQGPALSS